jgi:hypothetical protein
MREVVPGASGDGVKIKDGLTVDHTGGTRGKVISKEITLGEGI